MSILSGKSNQFQLPFIYLTVWEEPYLHRTSPKMKSLKWKISSHWETEPICCSYRTEDGQKRQEKGKVCWRKPSKILFSNLFSDQFWQNGDQRRVGVCWQRRSSLQGETHQLLGSIDHRWFSCLFLGGIDHWCLSYLFLGFINHRCFSCIFLGFIDHRCFSRRSSSPTSWVIDQLGSTYIRRLSRFSTTATSKDKLRTFSVSDGKASEASGGQEEEWVENEASEILKKSPERRQSCWQKEAINKRIKLTKECFFFFRFCTESMTMWGNFWPIRDQIILMSLPWSAKSPERKSEKDSSRRCVDEVEVDC